MFYAILCVKSSNIETSYGTVGRASRLGEDVQEGTNTTPEQFYLRRVSERGQSVGKDCVLVHRKGVSGNVLFVKSRREILKMLRRKDSSLKTSICPRFRQESKNAKSPISRRYSRRVVQRPRGLSAEVEHEYCHPIGEKECFANQKFAPLTCPHIQRKGRRGPTHERSRR